MTTRTQSAQNQLQSKMASEEDKKKTEGWKADADGILIFVSQTRSPVSLSVLRFFVHPPLEGHAMIRRLPHAEQPSRVDAAPLKTATHLFDRLREGRRGLRGDPAVSLGDAPVSRSARRTAQRRHSRLVCMRVPQATEPQQPFIQHPNSIAEVSLDEERSGCSPSPSIGNLDVRALKSLYALAAVPRIPTAAATVPPPRRPIRARARLTHRDHLWSTAEARAWARLASRRSRCSCRRSLRMTVRFSQAHDLLKKNAERAQKLAQDSNASLETYQRQVRTLEEQLASSDSLQEQVDQLAAEKLAVEERAAEEAEMLRRLTEVNGVLSVRALQLAEDAAAAAAQEELRAVNTVSEREQTQRLVLLEEINLVQTENGSLRQQLRALGKL